MTNTRIEYYDYLRGLAIIMVVGIHTFIPYSITTPIGFAGMIMRNILNCAVPIFLVLSGYLLGKKTFANKIDIISFWKKQIPKVYIPVLIWSIPYLIQNVIVKGGGISRGLILLITCSYSIYYFIALIVQYYLLLPLFQCYRRKLFLPSIVISFVSILIITYITKIYGIELPLILLAGPFPIWIMFFMFGVYYSVNDVRYSVRKSLFILVIGLVLSIMETLILNINYGGGYGIKPSSFIYSLGAIMLLLSPKMKSIYKVGKINSVISKIGQISFGIYLIHFLIIQYFCENLLKYWIIDVVGLAYPFKSWITSWIIVLILSSCTIFVSRLILPRNICRYLGFL